MSAVCLACGNYSLIDAPRRGYVHAKMGVEELQKANRYAASKRKKMCCLMWVLLVVTCAVLFPVRALCTRVCNWQPGLGFSHAHSTAMLRHAVGSVFGVAMC